MVVHLSHERQAQTVSTSSLCQDELVVCKLARLACLIKCVNRLFDWPGQEDQWRLGGGVEVAVFSFAPLASCVRAGGARQGRIISDSVRSWRGPDRTEPDRTGRDRSERRPHARTRPQGELAVRNTHTTIAHRRRRRFAGRAGKSHRASQTHTNATHACLLLLLHYGQATD